MAREKYITVAVLKVNIDTVLIKRNSEHTRCCVAEAQPAMNRLCREGLKSLSRLSSSHHAAVLRSDAASLAGPAARCFVAEAAPVEGTSHNPSMFGAVDGAEGLLVESR